MKKILALLLAAMMLVSLIACGDDPKPPIVDGSDAPADGTDGGTDAPADETDPPETEAPGPADYVPDMDAKYGGLVGIGTERGDAWFDNLKVVSKQTNKMELFFTDLEDGAMPEFTYATAVDGVWEKDPSDFAVVDDPLAEEGDKEIGKVIEFSGDEGSMAYIGSADWNFYQYSVKILPLDEETIVNLYFCIKDENNYFVLSIGESGGSFADCYQVVDGVKTSVATKVFLDVPVDSWSTVGITVERETIAIFVNGTQRFGIFDEEFVYSKSIAQRAASVDAPYCSSWESAASINDGEYPEATFNGGGTHYGSWSMAQTSETIGYTFEEEVTIDGIGLFFWHDTASRDAWLTGGGINSPASYTIQYLNENGEFVDVTGGEGYEVAMDKLCQTFFDAVTTTSIQITMYKFTDDEDAQYGFSAYADYTAPADGSTDPNAPTDPSTRGLGLYEFEVYEAGTVERPEA